MKYLDDEIKKHHINNIEPEPESNNTENVNDDNGDDDNGDDNGGNPGGWICFNRTNDNVTATETRSDCYETSSGRFKITDLTGLEKGIYFFYCTKSPITKINKIKKTIKIILNF